MTAHPTADDLAQLRAAFSGPMRHPADWKASVIALVRPDPAHGLELLLERRADGPRRFAGHLGFPGGGREPDDANALATALREAKEEVDVEPTDVDVLGLLADGRDPLGRPVPAYVGVLAAAARPRIASPETTELLWVPLASLRRFAAHGDANAAPDEHAGPRLRDARYLAHGYESRTYGDHRVHYWPLRAGDASPPTVLWGFTAGLTAQLLAKVWGWTPPGTPRVVADWSDLQP